MELSTACERFFAITELVSLSLHQGDAITLIRCQRVCCTWTDIIKRSETLQENLFLKTKDSPTEKTTSLEPVTLNPVAQAYFAALLATSELELPNAPSALRS